MHAPFADDDDGVDEEIRMHLEMAAADAMQRGESAENARAAARRDIGNVAQVKELAHEATATMFTVVRSVLLRPLPFAEPQRLFAVGHLPVGRADDAAAMFDFDFVRYRRETREFAALAMYHTYPMSFVGAGDPLRVPGARVTPALLTVLGIRPTVGRDFVDTDDAAPVVLISDALWRERFGGDTAAIGRSIDVDGERRTVVGVLPAGFDFPEHARIWLPMAVREASPQWTAAVVGRLNPSYIIGGFALEDQRTLPANYTTLKTSVTPDYLRVMGIAIRQGRPFDVRDVAGAPRVAIVSQSMAKQFWPDGDVLGRRISITGDTRPEDGLTIVPVVDDVVHQGLAKVPTPAIYQPIAQTDNRYFINHLTFVAKSDLNPAVVSAALRRAVHEADADLPTGTVTTMQRVIDQSIAEPRFQMTLFGVFAAIALLLAVVGIYGVLAYVVADRQQEIGIRMALGASPSAVRRMVVSRSLAMTPAGLAIGIAASFGLTRLLRRLLFEVTPTDPATFAGVALLLLGVAALASWLSARRAAKTDPLRVIRGA